jgi:hypothetical protein
MTLRRLLLIAFAATATASHQTTPHLAVSRLRGGAGASSAPTALTKKPSVRSKRPLSLIADAAAKFTLPKEAEIAIGAAGIFLSYSVLAVQQENVYAAQFGAIRRNSIFSWSLSQLSPHLPGTSAPTAASTSSTRSSSS